MAQREVSGPKPVPTKRVLAIASFGGHWEQLTTILRLVDDPDLSVKFAVASARRDIGDVGGAQIIPDFNRNEPLNAIKSLLKVAMLVARTRPHVIVTTGAAPGLAALALGRVIGAKTIWIDSVANAEELSMSGRIASKISHQCLTQWEHLARPGGPQYWGAVV